MPAVGPSPVPPTGSPDTLFHEKFAGNVSGSKPPVKGGAANCMPMRDTPKIRTDYNSFTSAFAPNKAFSHYLNLGNEQFVAPTTGLSKFDVYKNSNDYRRKTFFIGGKDEKLNCPDILALEPGPQPVPVLAGYQRAKAENCYNYYILNHSTAPWFILERPGESTDDPLSFFNPERAFLDSCQPLINGISAKKVMEKKWAESISPPAAQSEADKLEADSGFSPVYQYEFDPILDEAEYLISTYLKRTWKRNFEDNTPLDPNVPTYLKQFIQKDYDDIPLPCIQKVGGAPTYSPTLPIPDADTTTGPPNPDVVTGAGSCSETAGGGAVEPSPGGCPKPVFKAGSIPYTSAGTGPLYYCPNVEKVVEPSHPFSPRKDMSINDLMNVADVFGLTYPDVLPRLFDQFVTDGPVVTGPQKAYLTDRDYSWKTSICVPQCKGGIPDKRGYTTYHPIDCVTGKCIKSSRYYVGETVPNWYGLTVCEPPDGFHQWYPDGEYIYHDEQVREPIVQCGMVPVDIMEFRRDQFESCLMQRIAYNYNDWIEKGRPNPDGYTPPCKTRFYESDNAKDCPVKMSIQQCCHVILKDVVPANFLKYKTCEGLLQHRLDTDPLKVKFGLEDITHITDEEYKYGKCPPGFPDCHPISYSAPITGSGGGLSSTTPGSKGNGSDLLSGMGKGAYDKARIMTELLNGNSPSTDFTCGVRAMTGTQLYPTEPDEYRFGYYFKDFVFPELRKQTPDPYDFDPRQLGYHMPYMRRWDTGVSSGNPYHAGSYLNTLPGFDVWVGIGREERNKRDSELASDAVNPQGATDEGGSVKDRLKKEEPSQIGRTGGWAEAKAHQMWSTRRSNLSCIGRYEKLFKPGGPEQLVLSKAGSGYTTKDFHQWPWPLGWRGYATDSHDNSWFKPYPYGFPDFPQGVGNPSMAKVTADAAGNTGLDNALPGDIIVYKINGAKHIAYVTDIGFDKEDFKNAVFDPTPGVSKYKVGNDIVTPNRLFVVSWDQGKFPTATSSTLDWGMGPQRTIYKQYVPEKYREEICGLIPHALVDPISTSSACKDPTTPKGTCISQKCQPSCEDPYYSSCVLPDAEFDWKNAVVYRPYHDVRKCEGYGSLGASGQVPTSLDPTYTWTGNVVGGKSPPPDPNVIYQGDSRKVNSNVWSYCANAGWDPPPTWNKEYSGAQTGAVTDVTLCGPKWWAPTSNPPTGCAVAPKAPTKLFPEDVVIPGPTTPR